MMDHYLNPRTNMVSVINLALVLLLILVRSTKESDTRFVEIIHIREINGSLELNLQIFNNSLEPENISFIIKLISSRIQFHQKKKLTEVGDKRYLAFIDFKVSDGARYQSQMIINVLKC